MPSTPPFTAAGRRCGEGAEERQKNKKSTWLSAVTPKLSFPYVVNNLRVREAGAWGPSVGLPPRKDTQNRPECSGGGPSLTLRQKKGEEALLHHEPSLEAPSVP